MKLVARSLASGPATCWSHIAATAPNALPLDSLPAIAAACQARAGERVDDRFGPEERELLVAALEARLAAHRPPVAVLDALRRLRDPRAQVVLASAPPGLFGGTLASLWAALQALQLAHSLARALETPFVPVLWIDSDDWRPERVHPAWVLNEHEDPRRLGLASIALDGTPNGARRFARARDHHDALTGLVRQRLAREPHAARALELFAPREGASWSEDAIRVQLELLGRRGLVVVDSEWLREPLSRALADLFGPAHEREPLPWISCWTACRPADERASALVARLTPRSAEQAAAARAVHLDERGFCFVDEPGSRTAHELAAQIVGEPQAWIPAPALRPWVQAHVLPVAAQIVDADDALALARVAPLRALRGSGDATPSLVRRVQATLVEPTIAEALARTGIALERALALGADLVERERPADPPLAERIDRLAAFVARELDGARRELADDEHTLASGLRRTNRRVRDELATLRERVRRLHANRVGKDRRRLGRIARNLTPRGETQEACLGPLHFTARYGPELVEALSRVVPAASAAPLAIEWDSDADL